MKIAFVSHDAEVYGAPRSLLDLIDGLRAQYRWITCSIILPYPGPLLEEVIKRDLEYAIVPYPRWMHKRGMRVSGWRDLIGMVKDNRWRRAVSTGQAAFRISRLLRQWKVDIVYTNTSVIAVGAIAAQLSNTKHVWHIREFYEVIRLDWGRKVFSYLASKSAAVIFTSHVLQRYYASMLSSSKGTVVYNGVLEKKAFSQTKQLSAQRQRINGLYTFGMVGLISTGKGQQEAITALAQVNSRQKDARLLIAGKGNTESLNQLAERLGVSDQVQFLGHVEDPFSAVYSHIDAYLMCSAYESFGRVTVEAMAAALPVIGKVSPYSGTPELLQHEKTGLLYEGDGAELARQMRRLIDDQDWGRQLGQQAWEHAKEHFNKELYVEQIYQLLKSL